jgi:hypothetical protein
MLVTLNHTIVRVRDKQESATFLSEISVGDDGIGGCGPLRDHVASQLHDHRWAAPVPHGPQPRSNAQLKRPSADYATALASPEVIRGWVSPTPRRDCGWYP